MLSLAVSPDGKIVVANHSGYLPHGLEVFDTKTQKQIQHIELKTTWLGMTWSPDGHTLYVSGGNASGEGNMRIPSPRSTNSPTQMAASARSQPANSSRPSTPDLVWWSGVAYLPRKHWLYAANRGTGTGPSDVVVFDTKTRQIVTRIPVEVRPYRPSSASMASSLFVSNWSSESVSVIDTNTTR